MTRTLAAVDLGAQSGRVAVGRFDGNRLTVDVVDRFANIPVEHDGRLRWDFDRLRDDVVAALRKVGRDGDLASVAVDSWAVDFGLLDARDRLLGGPVHYRDRRRAAAYDSVLDRIPARELYERTAIQLLPINTIFELAALAADDDPTLAAASRLLLIPDLFHHHLCGSKTTERTNASTTQCLDPIAGTWATDVLTRLGVRTDILPGIVAPGTPLGDVGGVGAGVDGATVIATATHDTAAAVAAVPMIGRRCAYLSVGTWSLVGIESDEPVMSDAAFRANLTNESGVGGTYRVLHNITGLWLLHECRRAWAESGRMYEFADLVEQSQRAPRLRALIEPNDPMFAAPGDMPTRIVSYCEATGQEAPADDAAVARCILESLALKHAQTVDVLAAVTQREIDELHVVGGGANNELLCEWTAQASHRPVVAGPAEATVIGNLLVQAVALGDLGSLGEGRELVAQSFAPARYEPLPDAAWDDARARFDELAVRQPTLEARA